MAGQSPGYWSRDALAENLHNFESFEHREGQGNVEIIEKVKKKVKRKEKE